MKHFKLFNNEINYNAWLESDNFITPYVSKIKSNGNINYQTRIPLPYDKEIEYLESIDYQHIITELYGNENIGFEVKFNCNILNSLEDDESATIFGSRHSYNKNGLQLSTWKYGCIQHNNKLNSNINIKLTNTDYIVRLENNKIYVNNNEQIQINISSFITPTPIYIFALYQGETNNVREHFIGKIYYLKFFNRTTLKPIADFIPVRKDGIGYMYDKVSKQLFGNQGTGQFILGPDIT